MEKKKIVLDADFVELQVNEHGYHILSIRPDVYRNSWSDPYIFYKVALLMSHILYTLFVIHAVSGIL